MNQPEYKKEDGSLWQYFHKDFQGYEIIFRQNVVTGLIQMKVTDEMAIANGYKDLGDMSACISRDMGRVIILPEWMDVSESTDLYSHLN
ncbi:MAG: hypothetical protein HDR47_07085 [Bacteroides sp.]|nr:hypothetical protein [Bacteroides sp.]